ncbi:unnamed protein product, partial [marine sediment metagenome]
LAIALVLGTATQTLSIPGQYEKFLLIKVSERVSGTVLSEIWYSGFVRGVENE